MKKRFIRTDDQTLVEKALICEVEMTGSPARRITLTWAEHNKQFTKVLTHYKIYPNV